MAHMDISVELLAKKKLMTSSVERQLFFFYLYWELL